ncbi:hypothetical protein B0H14DRAFT_2618952 [Mycena olivaceomarginata]|nr:hypothetical protein B0H14DRAFT_2618952 [Mycena olivaceomarginata]
MCAAPGGGGGGWTQLTTVGCYGLDAWDRVDIWRQVPNVETLTLHVVEPADQTPPPPDAFIRLDRLRTLTADDINFMDFLILLALETLKITLRVEDIVQPLHTPSVTELSLMIKGLSRRLPGILFSKIANPHAKLLPNVERLSVELKAVELPCREMLLLLTPPTHRGLLPRTTRADPHNFQLHLVVPSRELPLSSSRALEEDKVFVEAMAELRTMTPAGCTCVFSITGPRSVRVHSKAQPPRPSVWYILDDFDNFF